MPHSLFRSPGSDKFASPQLRLRHRLETEMLTIRAATIADTGVLLELIRGLAEYEHLTHLVSATEETLKDALFGSQPRKRGVAP